MKHRKGHWERASDAVVNATRELPLFADEYFSQGRKAVKKNAAPEKLHQFRLESKHFRYLLELFRPLFGPRMDVLLKRLRKIQTSLGEINDIATARSLALQPLSKSSPESQQLSKYLSHQNGKKMADFRSFWKEEFDKDGEEERWKSYLSRPPRTIGPRKRPAAGSSRVSRASSDRT
jgi:hypothetical protein